MDWTKHAKEVRETTVSSEPKRIPIKVSPEMQKIMKHFRDQNPGLVFSDAGILATFLEAGVRLYLEDFTAKKRAQAAQMQQSEEDLL